MTWLFYKSSLHLPQLTLVIKAALWVHLNQRCIFRPTTILRWVEHSQVCWISDSHLHAWTGLFKGDPGKETSQEHKIGLEWKKEEEEKRIRRMLAECCFTSTETVGLLGTGAQDSHLDFHTAPELWKWRRRKIFNSQNMAVSAAILCCLQLWVCDVMNKVGNYYRSVTVVSPQSLVSCMVFCGC